MPLFDTHAHYNDDAFDQDREELLDALPAAGVGAVVIPGVDAPPWPWRRAAPGCSPPQASIRRTAPAARPRIFPPSGT